MSKEKNSQEEDFKKFLRESQDSSTPLDDFEKEAMEGFAILKSEEEKLNLKSELNNRIYKEVFSKNNTDKKLVIWLGAASLFLVISFSVYFVLNSEQPKTLAISEKITDPDKSENSNLKEFRAVEDSKYDENIEPVADNKESETSIKKNKDIKEFKPQNDSESDADDKGEKVQRQEEILVKEKPALNKDNSEQPGEYLNNDSRKRADSDVAGAAVAKQEIEDEEETDFAVESFANAPAQTTSNSNALNVPAAKSSSDKEAKMNQRATAKKSENEKPEINSASNCFYEGGKEKLDKDLKEKLTEKKLLQKFEVNLIIGKDGKVKDAKIIKAGAFSASQKSELIELLKKLDSFKFYNTSNIEAINYYHLEFIQ